MSYDVFAVGIHEGGSRSGGGAAARAVLQPFIERDEPEFHFLFIRTRDGGADVYLSEDSMMFNHFEGDRTCDLLVAAARAADWVIFPPGCPTCITNESQREHLPPGFTEHVRYVRTGQDLMDAIAIDIL
ncbi:MULTISPECIES: hypothetical protein [unclassified Actinomyces]|uniref:hypothetical protein n=1 Tax=unclassified Actinomyces TaxID=2609248 RepID=UPI000D59DE35|nr:MULTISPECIES: hypothetical protein [unclassified Actinomyces]RAX19151.1 hypothetical protein DRB06_14385 [Actinomyces sp. Z5]RAX20956.1 hypothetical protein DRB07_12745 [Actinomyces sp. Z3]